ncbi:MAG TPA: winged helix-turn-helix domain-containing protein [Blastocatellia bacterium]|nr:winged helix-turn-helix domain-containing protein [Blastocatellia bacterium]
MHKHTNQLYEFGPFRLDIDERLLMRDGRITPLPPKVFDTLLVLVENSGRVVSKDELMQSLWPDTFVEESNLTQNISQLRRALGDGAAEAQYIETIPKRGYRFVAGVQPLAVNGVSMEKAIAVNGHAPTTADELAAPVTEREQTVPLDADVATEKIDPKRFLAVATLIGCSLAIVVFALVVAYRRAGSDRAFQKITFIKQTASGNALFPAISHDGKYVAYVAEEGDLQSLMVEQVAVNSSIQVVAPAEVVFIGVTFSPDDNHLYYVTRPKSERLRTLYQVPLLGGAPREIMANVDSPITFSPDGQYIAFVRSAPLKRETALIVARHNGSEERKLATRKGPEELSPLGPSWSPDGRVIACGVVVVEEGEYFMRLFTFRVEDGLSEPIGSQKWTFIGQVAWLPDGGGLVFSVWQLNWGVYGDQLWLLRFPKGEARQLTNDMNSYDGVSVSANSASPAMLVTRRTDRVSSIWIGPEGAGGFDAERTSQIKSGFGDNDSEQFGLDWTPDGRLVYASQASGNVDIWITTTDGKQQKQLTRDTQNDVRPVVTPDGRYIIFASDRAGHRNIWRMEIDGGGLKKLTSGKFDNYPSLSPDSRWIVYMSLEGSGPMLWKVSIEGGEPERLSSELANRPLVSPDGKWISCFHRDENDGRSKVALIPFAGGKPTFIEGMEQPDFQIVSWSPDSRALNYIATRQGVSNIWSKPIDGGPARQLTKFTSDRIFRFAWSRDGKLLACERGVTIKDVVLISDGNPD